MSGKNTNRHFDFVCMLDSFDYVKTRYFHKYNQTVLDMVSLLKQLDAALIINLGMYFAVALFRDKIVSSLPCLQNR